MGHCCGPTENFSDVLIYWIYNPYTKHLIERIVVRPDTDTTNTKKHAVLDTDVIRNDKPEYDTDRKRRIK